MHSHRQTPEERQPRRAPRPLSGSIREHQRARRAGELFHPPAHPGDRPAITKLELATCECSRELRVAPGMLTDGAIVCGVCLSPFRPVGR